MYVYIYIYSVMMIQSPGATNWSTSTSTPVKTLESRDEFDQQETLFEQNRIEGSCPCHQDGPELVEVEAPGAELCKRAVKIKAVELGMSEVLLIRGSLGNGAA